MFRTENLYLFVNQVAMPQELQPQGERVLCSLPKGYQQLMYYLI